MQANKQQVPYINQYLYPFKASFITSRNKPLCSNVPNIGIGNQPIDDGNYLFTDQEKINFIKQEPNSAQYFKKWVEADEFINNRNRWCLYLGNCSQSVINTMPLCKQRVDDVRNYRSKSSRKSTQKLANTPTMFQTTNIPNSDYLCIPEISSENRYYVPIGFLDKGTLSSNRLKISDGASLFHFSILTSKVHMIWMRLVAGRLEMRYCYSRDIVYNNFVWIDPTPQQKQQLTQCGQDILNERNNIFTSCSQTTYADLYNNTSSANYPKLIKVHEKNDKEVLSLYGLPNNASDEDILERLFALYDVRSNGQKTLTYTDKKGKRHTLNLL